MGQLPYKVTERQLQEFVRTVIEGAREEPDELAVRLQGTADMIDDLFRSTKLLRRYKNRNANTAQFVEAAEVTFLSPRAEPSSPTPDVHSEDNWQESLWTLDDSETEESSDDDVESYAEE